MGVGENDGVEAARLHRKRRPILQPQRFEALKQAAVDEQPMASILHEEFRPGYRTDAAEKREAQAHAAISHDSDDVISLIARPRAGLIHVNSTARDPHYL
jgi:hypothetical protein